MIMLMRRLSARIGSATTQGRIAGMELRPRTRTGRTGEAARTLCSQMGLNPGLPPSGVASSRLVDYGPDN
jgi:hypothetical protein